MVTRWGHPKSLVMAATVLVLAPWLLVLLHPLGVLIGSLQHATVHTYLVEVDGSYVFVSTASPLSPSTDSNEARVAHARHACAETRYDVGTGLNDSRATSRLLVDDAHRLLYCVIPKAGCTTMKGVLVQGAGGGGFDVTTLNSFNKTTARQIHAMPAKVGLRYLNRFSAKGRYERLKWYTKLVVVRHPFSRLFSAYNDKMAHGHLSHPEFYRDVVRRYFPSGVDARGKLSLTFKQFLYLIAKEYRTGLFVNRHWMTYEQLCHPCVVQYDSVIRLETIHQDFARLAPQLNMTSSQLPRLNSYDEAEGGEHTENYQDHMAGVNPKVIKRLRQIYKADFDVFGYD